MIFSKKYNLINNAMGWGIFIIALATYWLTLEPTASYWDCGEFIIQADKLEIGHPPGNPIFMLTARFFVNFAFGDPAKVALMVNAMSGLLSALTILLLFWTVTHLVGRLLLKNGQGEPSLTQYLAIFGSGVCGALAYAWSDTFWFSAVEGEVYAFSSFCTALVFWLILKWENRADEPHSDRYLILIAYIIGVSIAVHLLNLLCIPAIVLVYAFRRFKDMNLAKSLLALAVSFAIIVLVLYGLVPGFIEVATWFELLGVNVFGFSYNTGVIIYAVLTAVFFICAIHQFYVQRSPVKMRVSFLLSAFMSGIFFIGSGVWIGLVLYVVLAFLLFGVWHKQLPVRWLNLALWSMAVIFVGYSSYALILVRSSANTPMNQNAPDNVFDLSSYLNREQYGETPLLYGPTFNAIQMQQVDGYSDVYADYGLENTPVYSTIIRKGKPLYSKVVAGHTPVSLEGYLSDGEKANNANLVNRGTDAYLVYDYDNEFVMNPELNMLLPRIYSGNPSQKPYYSVWVPSLNDESINQVELTAYDPAINENVPMLNVWQSPEVNDVTGSYYWPVETARKPTMGENLEYFLNYQVNHMYWRYFLWNFAGRQNDINNQFGEKDAGNWISGIPFIDNPRLGDQSLLPDEYGKDNKGHNVFYMLPLILGLIGLFWQAFSGKRGIEQFWVIFFLFFMTGLAIVLYLNQPPNQPRERDYAYAGSFYAFAIWIGMGVAALWRIGCFMMSLSKKRQQSAKHDNAGGVSAKNSLIVAVMACVIGLAVPLQMVSQTWDDHDRSDRTAARDYAINYLESLEPNAIIFCNGDNDTFPLWYAQEVEGVRPDVKIINLSYLGAEWYANQQRLQTYDAAPVDFTASPSDYAYHRRDVVYRTGDTYTSTPVSLVDALKAIYSDKATNNKNKVASIPYANTYIPVNKSVVMKRGLVPAGKEDLVEDRIPVNLNSLTLGQTLMLDIIATNAANGWKRPIYWAMTVGSDNYSQFMPYMRSTGMAYQLVPYKANMATDTQKTTPVVMNKYRWGGADKKTPYFDETAGRMLSGVRMTMLDLSSALIDEIDEARINPLLSDAQKNSIAKKKALQAAEVLKKFETGVPEGVRPYTFNDVITLGTNCCIVGEELNNPVLTKRGLKVLGDGIKRYAQNVRYAQSLIQKYESGYSVDDKSATAFIAPNVQLTQENSNILSSYYHLVLLYEKFGGKKAVDKILSEARISKPLLEQLKTYYEYATNPEAAAAILHGESGESGEDILSAMIEYGNIVVQLQSLPAVEYAAATDQERQIDSIFLDIVDQYISVGGSQDELLRQEVFGKIDWDRLSRLNDQFRKNHPDLYK